MNATPEKMWALRMHEPGGPDRLTYEEVDVPSVAVGDVLVRVHAASFTPTELGWPSTWIDRSGRDRRPVVRGYETPRPHQRLGLVTTVCPDGTTSEIYDSFAERRLVGNAAEVSRREKESRP
jgi:D-arabinose 1-dehydrogenase-like Zn-dependent alcohol dehydrogenase